MHLEIQVDPIPADLFSDNAASLTSIEFLDDFVTFVDTTQVPCLMDPVLGDLDVEAFIAFHFSCLKIQKISVMNDLPVELKIN